VNRMRDSGGDPIAAASAFARELVAP
jgi:hypothetical protein